MRALASAATFVLLTVTVSAQWLTYRVPGTPRLGDGSPNLSAAAPRAADGRPDLSGVWAAERNRQPGAIGSGFVRNRHGGNIAIDRLGGAPLTDWGRATLDARRKAARLEIPTGIHRAVVGNGQVRATSRYGTAGSPVRER